MNLHYIQDDGSNESFNLESSTNNTDFHFRAPGELGLFNRQRNRNVRGRTLSRKWPNGIIIYQISNSLARFRPVILTAMQRIESETCIIFQQRQSHHERDYIFLINGDGCHSIVGRARGRQIISLGVGCRDVGSIIHELCHAIGLYHEHMRFDRDQYLRIKWQNISPSMYDQFEKIPISEYRPAHRFDYNSIMIYGSKAFSKNGKDTMVPLDKRASIRESHHKYRLSKGDIININALYGC